MKKFICVVMMLSVIVNSFNVQALTKKNKVLLSNKKVVIRVGQKKNVKLKNVKSRVKWKILKGRKLISIRRKGKYKNKIVIIGKKEGKAVLQANYGKKKYKIKIHVKKKEYETKIKSPQTETAVEQLQTTMMQPETITQPETTTEYRDDEIIGQLQKNMIVQGKDLLIINYTLIPGTVSRPSCYVYTSAPLHFQRYVNGEWIDIPLVGEPFESDYVWICSQEVDIIKVDLTKHYGNLPVGRYKYVKRFVFNDGLYPSEWTPDEYINADGVKGIEVSVEFNIVSG